MKNNNQNDRTSTVIRKENLSYPREKRPALWFSVVFLCMICMLTLLTIFMPKQSFSEGENRVLAATPALSYESVLSGDYFRSLQTYFADHFLGRDFWMTLQLRMKQTLGLRENGGVYLGNDDTLFLVPGQVNEAALKKNEDAVNAFAAHYDKLSHYMMIVPNAFSVDRAHLPPYAPVPDQASQLSALSQAVSEVAFVDPTAVLLSHREERLYYKTDHHWTGLGAYYAFGVLCDAMELTPAAQYDRMTLSTSFEGTLASKSGKHKTKDTIEIFVPQSDVQYYVTYDGGLEKTPTMYQTEALSQRDQYAVFLGGNHPMVDIMSTADSGRRLLLFKDSYANSFVQFLIPSFEEIVLIDPRYYYDSVYPLISQKGITDVLYLYNADTFFGDTALADVLALPAE